MAKQAGLPIIPAPTVSLFDTSINIKLPVARLSRYLSKIKDEDLYAYNVYQIEGIGKNLFSKINGDKNTIMGLPVKKIKEYLNNIK